MLRDIEKATRQPIEEMPLPSAAQVNAKRREAFRARIIDALNTEKNALYREIIESVLTEHPVDALDVAAACASLIQGDKALFIDEKADQKMQERKKRDRDDREPRQQREPRDRGDRGSRGRKATPDINPLPLKGQPNVDMVRYMVSVGYDDGLRPGNLVGAVANEADLESRYIGHIEILENYSIVDLPAGMPPETMKTLRNARVCGRALEIKEFKGEAGIPERKPGGPKRRDGGFKGKGSKDRDFKGSRDFKDKPRKPHRKGGNAPARKAD